MASRLDLHLARDALAMCKMPASEVAMIPRAALAASMAAMLCSHTADAESSEARGARLRRNVLSLGDVRPELIDDAVTAAIGVETPAVPAELLLSLAWWESRLEPSLRNGRVCGALQVKPEDVGERGFRDTCHRWGQDTWLGFQAGVDELETWLEHARGNMGIALRGRSCGWIGLTRGCDKDWWIDRVRQTVRKLRKD